MLPNLNLVTYPVVPNTFWNNTKATFEKDTGWLELIWKGLSKNFHQKDTVNMGDTEDAWGPEAVTVTHEPWHRDTAEEDKWQSSGQWTQCDTWRLALACHAPGSLAAPPDTNKSLLTLQDLAEAVGDWPCQKRTDKSAFLEKFFRQTGLRYFRKNMCDPQCLACILFSPHRMPKCLWLMFLF